MKSQLKGKEMRNAGGVDNQGKHNPITNPINFNIGITNPYVIKEYEQTKERYMGDNHLKLENLAMVGRSSLHKH